MNISIQAVVVIVITTQFLGRLNSLLTSGGKRNDYQVSADPSDGDEQEETDR